MFRNHQPKHYWHVSRDNSEVKAMPLIYRGNSKFTLKSEFLELFCKLSFKNTNENQKKKKY